MNEEISIEAVRRYLLDLQQRLCAAFEAADGRATFTRDEGPAALDGQALPASARSGHARPRVLEDGAVLERAAVHFSHNRGDQLPAAATARRPEVAGRAYEALSVSVIAHPLNPFAPTAHCNLRFFRLDGDGDGSWWFGGGFDLTPYYGFVRDAREWHQAAFAACRALVDDEAAAGRAYRRFKAACDAYFHLPHRHEARGIGGIFFDDLAVPSFARVFAFARAVGDAFADSYLAILRRRHDRPYGERERDFQLYRRGRYVEFNLLHDRGTRFGLESGGPVESILASLPPVVRWRYAHQAAPGSAEARLDEDFLRPRDWLAEA